MNGRGLVKTLKGWLGRPIAGPETDPTQWLGTLYALPNPDPILRNMGQAEQVYASILADAHVIGDVRSIRGNFRSYRWRLVPGDKADAASVDACAMCTEWVANTPPGGVDEDGLQLDWLEVMWQMTSSILTGYRAHEVTWDIVQGDVLPVAVDQRRGQRFRFDAHGRPMVVTRDNMVGRRPDHPSQFVISRHMPTTENPYGVALLSSCFWPWTFKTGGWRYFVKYCERHGLPWPFATYPAGSLEPDIDALEKAVANMLEAGYVVAPQGSEVELITPGGGGVGSHGLPQQALIDLANREMSKAITGQAMVAELQGVGARAASETASDRQHAINDSDRDIAVSGMGQIFRWITRFNFGDGVAAPQVEFYVETTAGKDRAESYEIAANMGARPSRKSMLEELRIPQAEDDADALLPNGARSEQTPPAAALRLAGSSRQAANFQKVAPADAAATPLYVSRKVVNAAAIVAWAREQGLNPVPAADLHLTVAFSREPVAHGALPADRAQLVVQGGARSVKPLGVEGAVVLTVESAALQERWQAYRDAGASWDWDGYVPHVTITYDTLGVDPADAAPYTGPVILGPEVQEPLQLDDDEGATPAAVKRASTAVGLAYARELGLGEDEALQLAVDAADRAIADHMIAPVVSMLARFESEGRTLADFSAALQDMVGVMDDAALRQVLERALSYSILTGAVTEAA